MVTTCMASPPEVGITGPVFSKPIFSLWDLSTGARLIDQWSLAEYEAGHFWLPVLPGPHLSTDAVPDNGYLLWTYTMRPIVNARGSFVRWETATAPSEVAAFCTGAEWSDCPSRRRPLVCRPRYRTAKNLLVLVSPHGYRMMTAAFFKECRQRSDQLGWPLDEERREANGPADEICSFPGPFRYLLTCIVENGWPLRTRRAAPWSST
jgi:hypothetical protein